MMKVEEAFRRYTLSRSVSYDGAGKKKGWGETEKNSNVLEQRIRKKVKKQN